MTKPVIRSSETDRVLSCNGSLTLTRIVNQRDGDEGHEGVMLHWMIADRLIREHGAMPPEGGLPPPDVPNGYKLPAFSVWIVDWAIRHVMEMVPPTWSIMVEVEMGYEFDRWINLGHADVVAFNPEGTESLGIDWKTGRDPVDPADNNEQVFSYECLKKLNWDGLTKCTFQIAQPRLTDDDEFERVSTVVLEGDRLERAAATMDARMCVAMDNQNELNTGLKQCKYCIGCSCPAIRKLMKMQLTPEILAAIKATPDDATLGDFVITSRLLAKPAKDALELLHARLDKTPSIQSGDHTIKRTIQKGDYTVPDPVKFMQAVRKVLPSDDSIARTFTPSMTRIKDEIAAVMDMPKTSKAGNSAEVVFDGYLRPLVEQGDRRLLIIT